jgi:hypothetical protein
VNATEAALAAFPELQRLIDLCSTGWWLFLPATEPNMGLVEVRGVRPWPGSGTADAVRVRYVTDAAGLRSDETGGVVWKHEGDLVEVVDGLLSLPPPDSPGAPRLVRGRARQGLWLP